MCLQTRLIKRSSENDGFLWCSYFLSLKNAIKLYLVFQIYLHMVSRELRYAFLKKFLVVAHVVSYFWSWLSISIPKWILKIYHQIDTNKNIIARYKIQTSSFSSEKLSHELHFSRGSIVREKPYQNSLKGISQLIFFSNPILTRDKASRAHTDSL